MAGSTIRKALGAVKDQTSISIAKVSSNVAPEIDVAVVKATSHEDEPASDKYIREIFSLTSSNRPNVAACISAVSRRLGKTRDWIVALKTLMLVHRLLADGDRGFQEEIMYATRRGARLLNMTDFRDEAHSSSWDHSAFVRSYALYLDQKLECVVFEKKQCSRDGHGSGWGDRNEREKGYYRNEREKGYHSESDYDRERRYDDERRDGYRKQQRTPAREMKPEVLLDWMSNLQKLMDKFLTCRPSGRAKSSRMVLVALYPIVRESFQLYAEVCDVLSVLIERFVDLEYTDCVKAFEWYANGAKQIGELVGFYNWCRDTGLARSSEYPEVERIKDSILETLEEILRDKARNARSPEFERARREERVVAAPAEEEEYVEEMGAIKALPAPEGYEPKESVKVPEVEKKQEQPQQKQPPQESGNLVDLREDNTMTADDQGNKLALSLFTSSGSTSTLRKNGEWEAFPSEGGEPAVTSAWQTPATECPDWELALVETASNLSKQKAAMAGGFDPLLLDGIYEQGAVRQHVNAKAAGGSSSSVALPMPGSKATQVLALPAPDGSVTTIGNEDPFAASLSVPPPSYVQMAEVEKKQQLLIQEQLLWQQYTRDGMQGQSSLNKLSMGYTNMTGPVPYGYYTAP